MSKEDIMVKNIIRRINVKDENTDIYVRQMFDGCDNIGPESWVINILIKGKDQNLNKYDLYLDIKGNLSGLDTKKTLSFINSKQINEYIRNSKYRKIKLKELFNIFSINNIEST